MPKAGNDINRMLAEHIHARLLEKKGISAFDDMAPELRDEMDYLAVKSRKKTFRRTLMCAADLKIW